GDAAPDLRLMKAMGEVIVRRQGCMVVLLDSDSPISADALQEIGATHFLREPFCASDLAATVRLAERLVMRSQMLRQNQPGKGKQLENQTWSWSRITNQVQISPGLARVLGDSIPTTVVGLEALLRFVEPERKRHVLAAFQEIL